MINIFKNERGATLIEVISVMLATTVLIVAATFGIIAFFKSYRQLSAFVALQQEAMETIVTIQNGIDVEPGDQARFMGVANAKSLRIINYSSYLNKGDGIEIRPPTFEPVEAGDYLRVVKENNEINAYYSYHGRYVGPVRLFPSKEYEDIVEIKEFAITDPNRNYAIIPTTELGIIGVELEARVLLRGSESPSKRKYRSIKFRTLLAMK